MKTKIFSLFTIFTLAAVLLASLSSAALQFSPLSFPNVTVDFGRGSTTINFNLSETNLQDYDNLTWSATSSVGSLSLPVLGNISQNNLVQLSTTLVFSKTFVGNITSTINLTDIVLAETVLLPITVFVVNGPSELSECVTTGNSNFVALDIDTPDVTGFGEDEEWYPLDEIEITVNVDNNGGEDLKNIALGWGLYDLDDQSFIIDDEEKDFDLKKGKDQDVVISFKLEDPDDFSDNNDLVFLVWANGEGKDTDTLFCNSGINDKIEVQIDEFVILDDFQYPETVQCSEDVVINADLWNAGDEDQELVYVLVTNKDLGLNQERIDFGDVDAFDKYDLSLTFQVPLDAEQKIYPLTFEVYSEDIGGIYENDLNDDESRYVLPLKVEGGCIVQPTLAVSAKILSGGNAGEPLEVTTNITNIGKKTATYTLNSAGYSLWADSATLSTTSLSLSPGQSREVTVTLQVKDTARGEQRFEIEVLSGNELVMAQPVNVFIEGKGLLTRIAGGSWYLWLIGLANVALVVGIIIVVVRMFRK